MACRTADGQRDIRAWHVTETRWWTAWTAGIRGRAAERRCINICPIRELVCSPAGYSPTGEIFNLTLEDGGRNRDRAGAEKLVFSWTSPACEQERRCCANSPCR